MLYRFRTMILIVFVGVVVSMAMAPSVAWLQRHRLPRSVSVIVIYLVLMILLIGFIVLLVPPIVEQLTATVPKIESYYRDLKAVLVVIVVLVLVDEYGLIGVMLAPPLAAAIQSLAGQLMRSTTTAKATLAQPISALQANLASVQSLLVTQTVPPGPELGNLVDRLTQLIARADQELQSKRGRAGVVQTLTTPFDTG